MGTTFDYSSTNPSCLGVGSSSPMSSETTEIYPIISEERKLLNDFLRGRGDFPEIHSELFGYVRKYMGNRENAEDVMNEIWIKVNSNADKFDDKQKFRPWLYRVATNVCIDYQRKNKRHRIGRLVGLVSLNYEEENKNVDYDPKIPEVSYMNPLDKMELDEEKEKIKEDLEKLEPNHKELISLIYFQGLKYREAAQVVRIPIGTVKSRMHAGMKQLEKLVKKREAA